MPKHGTQTAEGRRRIRSKQAKQERLEWRELVPITMEPLHQLKGTDRPLADLLAALTPSRACARKQLCMLTKIDKCQVRRSRPLLPIRFDDFGLSAAFLMNGVSL